MAIRNPYFAGAGTLSSLRDAPVGPSYTQPAVPLPAPLVDKQPLPQLGVQPGGVPAPDATGLAPVTGGAPPPTPYVKTLPPNLSVQPPPASIPPFSYAGGSPDFNEKTGRRYGEAPPVMLQPAPIPRGDLTAPGNLGVMPDRAIAPSATGYAPSPQQLPPAPIGAGNSIFGQLRGIQQQQGGQPMPGKGGGKGGGYVAQQGNYAGGQNLAAQQAQNLGAQQPSAYNPNFANATNYRSQLQPEGQYTSPNNFALPSVAAGSPTPGKGGAQTTAPPTPGKGGGKGGSSMGTGGFGGSPGSFGGGTGP